VCFKTLHPRQLKPPLPCRCECERQNKQTTSCLWGRHMVRGCKLICRKEQGTRLEFASFRPDCAHQCWLQAGRQQACIVVPNAKGPAWQKQLYTAQLSTARRACYSNALDPGDPITTGMSLSPTSVHGPIARTTTSAGTTWPLTCTPVQEWIPRYSLQAFPPGIMGLRDDPAHRARCWVHCPLDTGGHR